MLLDPELFLMTSMKIYLDNCILVDIEKGSLNLSDFCRNNGTEYFFSLAHINELSRGVFKTPDLKRIRLSTLSVLCGDNFLDEDDLRQSIELTHIPADIVFARCELLRKATAYFEQVVAKYNPNRQGIIDELNINKIEIGNIDSSDILKVLESKLLESSYHLGVEEFLRLSEAFTLKAKYSTLFNLLDSVFYWKDEQNINRLYDSAHACCAQYCDVLVTNDRRMAIKAKAIYSYLGVKTRVVNSEEYCRLT